MFICVLQKMYFYFILPPPPSIQVSVQRCKKERKSKEGQNHFFFSYPQRFMKKFIHIWYYIATDSMAKWSFHTHFSFLHNTKEEKRLNVYPIFLSFLKKKKLSCITIFFFLFVSKKRELYIYIYITLKKKVKKNKNKRGNNIHFLFICIEGTYRPSYHCFSRCD